MNDHTRALILAAGRGSRMGNETAAKPKCLTLLAGRTLIEWQVNALLKAGITEIGIVKGYKADLIEIGDVSYINPIWSETNMVYSLFCAPPFTGNTIVSYSDITYHSSHIEKLLASKDDIVITADLHWYELWSERLSDPLDDAESFISENGVLREIGKKTDNYTDIQAQYMGLIKLSSYGWSQVYNIYQTLSVENRKVIDMTSMLNLLISRGIEIRVIEVEGKWCEADTMEDVRVYEKKLKERNWRHDWR